MVSVTELTPAASWAAQGGRLQSEEACSVDALGVAGRRAGAVRKQEQKHSALLSIQVAAVEEELAQPQEASS